MSEVERRPGPEHDTAALPRTYRRCALAGPRKSILTSATIPRCGYGQVLVKVKVNGICASDLKTWQTGPEDKSSSIFLGHEPVGEVVAIGPAVAACSVGDTVTGRIDQSYAEYALAAEADVVVMPPLPAGMALGEPLGCVVDGLLRTPIDIADTVAVVGAGFMGLCALQILSHCCTSRLIAIDPRPDARAAAAQHGADDAISPERAHDLSLTRGSSGYDVVIEASGTEAGLALATELARPHGSLAIMGYHQQARTVDMQAWNYKALNVINAHVRDVHRLRRSTQRALDLAAAGRINPASLITHRYTLANIDNAFADLERKPEGFVKGIVDIA
jgi:threonine dehydrogenase-like Zn-dependent dehydrogenase